MTGVEPVRGTERGTDRATERGTQRGRERRAAAGRAVPWLLTAGMTAAAVLRWSGPPPMPLGIGVQAISSWLLTPAFPLALAASRRRRRPLAAVAFALGLLQVAALWPDLGHFDDQQAPPGSTRIRLVTANLLLDNNNVSDFAAQVRAMNPDVLLLQEITPWNLAELKTAGLLDAFEYQVLDPREGVHGSLILSRLPLRDGGPFHILGWPMTKVDVITAAGPVRVVNVHTVAPLAAERIGLWQDQLTELGRMQPPLGGHLVLAGDFNATAQHRPFARILHPGLRDAFVQAGRGVGHTWPSDQKLVPGLMRIDHVLVSGRVLVTKVSSSRTSGSDHRALIADLALPASPAPSALPAPPTSPTGPTPP